MGSFSRTPGALFLMLTLFACSVDDVVFRPGVGPDGMPPDAPQGAVRLIVSTVQLAVGETGQAALTVALSERPAGAVAISISPSNGAKLAVSPATVRIEPVDYATPQTITVTARDDDDVADEQQSVKLEAAGLGSVTVQVNVADNDGLGLVVAPGSSLEIGEGTDEPMRVRLSARPSAPVTATLTSSDAQVAVPTPATLTFTPDNWQTAQPVMIAGRADANSSDDAASIAIGGDELADIAVTVKVFDDDVLALALSASNLDAVNEGGERALTVQLTQPPQASVEVDVIASPAAALSVAQSRLTFTPANWNVPQPLQVSALHDPDTVGRVALVRLVASGLSTRTMGVAIVDDDVQAITASDQVTVPEGASVQTGVRLAFQPEGDVVLNASSLSTGTATVSPPQLTFTRDNYATPQQLTIDALEDADAAPGGTTLRLEEMVTGMVKELPLVIAENDILAIESNPPALSLAEGASTSVGVRLTAMPLSEVTVALSSNDAGAAIVAPASLSFTSANWSTYQMVTVSSLEDNDLANENVSLRMAAGVEVGEKVLSVGVSDNDTQVIQVSRTSLAVTEGQSSTFTVQLGFQPAGNVAVNIASNNPGKATASPASITFSAADYSTPRMVTVSGIHDPNLVSEQAQILASSPSAVDATVAVTINDDDTQAVIVSPGSLTLPSGSNGSFTVRLQFQPSANATVSFSSVPGAVVGVIPSSVTFTASDYGTNRTVEVRPVQTLDAKLIHGPFALPPGGSTATIRGTSPNATDGVVQVTIQDGGSCGDGICRPPEDIPSCPEDCCRRGQACFQ